MGISSCVFWMDVAQKIDHIISHVSQLATRKKIMSLVVRAHEAEIEEWCNLGGVSSGIPSPAAPYAVVRREGAEPETHIDMAHVRQKYPHLIAQIYQISLEDVARGEST